MWRAADLAWVQRARQANLQSYAHLVRTADDDTKDLAEDAFVSASELATTVELATAALRGGDAELAMRLLEGGGQVGR